MTLTKDLEFTQIIEEIAKISDDVESECINQTPVPIWKLQLQLINIRELVSMAEERMYNEK